MMVLLSGGVYVYYLMTMLWRALDDSDEVMGIRSGYAKDDI
jgi:hypothetical protein